MSRIDQFIELLTIKIGDFTKKSELQHIWNELDKCSIVIQSGLRKGKTCGKTCGKNKVTCYRHDTLQMCSYENCIRKCSIPDTICEFHKKEEKSIESKNKPYPHIRWSDPYYVIKDTNVIIDVPNQVILGYKKELQCIGQETEEITKTCSLYKLRFLPQSVDNTIIMEEPNIV